MTWLPDVVTLTTITSVWGNTVRNQLCQRFDTIAERDSHTAQIAEGVICYVWNPDTYYLRRVASPGGWQTLVTPWLPITPVVIVGGVNRSANMTYVRCVYRRLMGTTAELDYTINFTSNDQIYGSVSVALPVGAYTDHGAVGSIIGGGFLADFGNARRYWCPAQLAPNNFVGFIEEATGSSPVLGTPNSGLQSIKVRGSYQCVDG